MVRVFAIRAFFRFMKEERLSDDDLLTAISNLESGKGSDDLGAGVQKVRIARKGQGKSGGYRVLIAIKIGERAVFLHGYAKNDYGNISAKFLSLLREAAGEVLSRSEEQVELLIASGAWREIARSKSDETARDGIDEDSGEES